MMVHLYGRKLFYSANLSLALLILKLCSYLKSLLIEKDQQIWKFKDSIISLQQKVTVLRKKLKEKEDVQTVIIDELAREKEHAIQANAAAVVASTKLARTRSLQNEIEDANKDKLKPDPGSIFADGVYVERMEWEKELRN